MTIWKEKEMIKNIIYLDEDKMYSLSSQLFEGITEYVLNETSSESSESEEQKGSFSSGRIVGDILKNSERNTEKKFLDDYSYTLFEKELIKENKVVLVTSESCELNELMKNKSFIKVTARATFNDINSLIEILNNFNQMGKSLTYVTNYENINSVKQELTKAQESKSKDERHKIGLLNSQLKEMCDIDKLSTKSGLQLDEQFLKDLSFLLKYGLGDQLEIQMHLSNNIASANLNRKFLREKEDLLIRKYSRQTEVEFTLFGIVTQYRKKQNKITEEDRDYANLKEAIMNMVTHITNLESMFTGRLNNEIIIDPIALYTEL